MPTTKTIGNRIAEARKKVNISQAQLAQRLFISPQAVGKWERGESMPDILTFNRLAEILAVDLNYFSESFPSAEAVMPSSVSPRKKAGWDMSSGNWVDADFSGLKDLHEKFSSSNMQRCKLVGSALSGLQMRSNNIDSCDFSGADLGNSKIQLSNLDNNLFNGSSLKGAEFFKSHVQGCDFSGADFSGSSIKSSHFSNNLFTESALGEGEFLKSYFESSDFSRADFSGVSFKSGGFHQNKVVGAVWNRCSFADMQIADVVFEGGLKDCYFEKCVFNWVKFQNAILINTFFKHNKFKRIKFVDCSADRITYELLKSGQADVSGIYLITT